MPRKLPPYFIKADPDSPCDKCEKVRGTCHFCERCYDCCECCPMYVCPYCHKAQIGAVQDGSDMVKELGGWCECEPCAGGCGKNIMDRDLGNYREGRYEPWCDACFAREEAKK
jgi:hypothetical protein